MTAAGWSRGNLAQVLLRGAPWVWYTIWGGDDNVDLPTRGWLRAVCGGGGEGDGTDGEEGSAAVACMKRKLHLKPASCLAMWEVVNGSILASRVAMRSAAQSAVVGLLVLCLPCMNDSEEGPRRTSQQRTPARIT